jgi:transcriptional regulator with XRE-family HTH domain
MSRHIIQVLLIIWQVHDMTTKYLDESFTDRIKKIIGLTGSAEKLANITGMSSRIIGQYLAGKSDPTRKKLIALSDAAKVNIEWLATGNGPIKERFNLELLVLIIAALDHLETKLGVKMKAVEKSIVLIYTYLQYFNADLSLDETRFAIVDNVKGNYNLLTSLDTILDTKKGQEQAIKTYTKILSDVFTQDGAEQAAEALIGAKLMKG